VIFLKLLKEISAASKNDVSELHPPPHMRTVLTHRTNPVHLTTDLRKSEPLGW